MLPPEAFQLVTVLHARHTPTVLAIHPFSDQPLTHPNE